ncbi:MAG: hypothetical protein IMZ51_04115, partial [Chloroflexi bacterium]|nr:hypothetical protein [Chloroflexota bacterium]
DLSDSFFAYFKKFNRNKKLINLLANKLKLNKIPYDYVEGNTWLLLSEVDYSRNSANLLMNIAKIKILDSKTSLYLRYGLLEYLAPLIYRYNSNVQFKIYCKYIYEKSPLILGLLLSSISIYFNRNDYIKIIKQSLKRTKSESGLIVATRLAFDNIKFRGLKVKGIKSPVRDTLVGLGLTSSQSIPKITPFQEIIKDRYKIDIIDWKKYLKKEYSHAHKIIVIAESAFYLNPSFWICNIDSFNNIVVISIINLDSSLKQKTVGNDRKLVNYGVLIAKRGSLDKKYAFITDILREVHQRRCQIPEAHPFHIKTRKRSKYLKQGERNYYFGKLKKAYLEIDRIFQTFI